MLWKEEKDCICYVSLHLHSSQMNTVSFSYNVNMKSNWVHKEYFQKHMEVGAMQSIKILVWKQFYCSELVCIIYYKTHEHAWDFTKQRGIAGPCPEQHTTQENEENNNAQEPDFMILELRKTSC